MSEAKQKILDCADALGLTMTAEFVPWSQSRNKGEKSPSLNWRVTLHRSGRDILTTDYMAGCGNCPAYQASVKEMGGKNSIGRDKAIRMECEDGWRVGLYSDGTPHRLAMKPDNRLLPDLADVLHSLSLDASVIDCPTYEEWASETGMEPDSRKGEAIYRACLEIALKLRAAIGEDGLRQLAEACQDY